MVDRLTRLESLEAQAMTLTEAERTHLLERLVASLDVDPEMEAAWDRVAEQREAELAAGHVSPVPVSEALARIRDGHLP
jgi:hypothetical protein